MNQTYAVLRKRTTKIIQGHEADISDLEIVKAFELNGIVFRDPSDKPSIETIETIINKIAYEDDNFHTLEGTQALVKVKYLGQQPYLTTAPDKNDLTDNLLSLPDC